MAVSRESVIPKKVVVEDNCFFDYIGISQDSPLKELVVVTDRQYKFSFLPYLAVGNWLDLTKAIITCPYALGVSEEMCNKVTDFLIKCKAPIGAQLEECVLEWREFKLRSIYAHYGMLILEGLKNV